ncbi:MAG: endonuclease III domain-containing protein [Spirochaetes bacterium]|jgi:endonuclease-3 related protein|nr:endonuclease III domain-containing protein [Spirochaetota bacterium]
MNPSLNKIYRALLKTYGPQYWWPGDTPFEISIGAILTQNVSWKNVETAIGNLKAEKLITPKTLYGAPDKKIAPLIRPTGYYNQKTKKIKNFLGWFKRYNFSFARLEKIEPAVLRQELLSINGIGPETADSILLYAISKKIFVVDAYTKRIFGRIGFFSEKSTYHEIQDFFHGHFRGDVSDYNEFHALIVKHGKDVCRTKPLCGECCIKEVCMGRC